MSDHPLIVGIGGTTAHSSTTEVAVSVALEAAARAGARTRLFEGRSLASLPHYAPSVAATSPFAMEFIATVRAADGLIIASPGYHGSISGLVKNAIDFFEELSKDARVYLDGLPAGLIATAFGWQAAGSTLSTLRTVVHALRAWPTPFGAVVNTAEGVIKGGQCVDPKTRSQLELVGRQVAEFALLRLQSQKGVTRQRTHEHRRAAETDIP